MVKPLRAFILGAPTPLSAGLAHGWLRAGHRISAIYCAERGSNPGRVRKDDRLGRYCAQISLRAVTAQHGLAIKFIGGPDDWEALETNIGREHPDIVLSLMFMARIPPRIIEATKDRLLNLHPALLPAYRGLSSLSSMQYDRTAADFAGLTLHVVEEEFDTGPIIAKVAVPPPPTGSFADHLHALIVVGGKLLGQAVPAYLEGQLPAMPQDDETARRWKSHAETDLVVRSSHRMSEIQEIFTSVGPLHKLALEGSPPSIKVDGFRSRLGPSRSLPMRLRWKSIDFDLADGRVRLRRASPWRDRLRNIALMRRLVQLTLSSSSART